MTKKKATMRVKLSPEHKWLGAIARLNHILFEAKTRWRLSFHGTIGCNKHALGLYIAGLESEVATCKQVLASLEELKHDNPEWGNGILPETDPEWKNTERGKAEIAKREKAKKKTLQEKTNAKTDPSPDQKRTRKTARRNKRKTK